MKYFLKIFGLIEIEVTKDVFIKTEELCGFYSKTEGEPATWDFGFNKNGLEIHGRQQKEDE